MLNQREYVILKNEKELVGLVLKLRLLKEKLDNILEKHFKDICNKKKVKEYAFIAVYKYSSDTCFIYRSNDKDEALNDLQNHKMKPITLEMFNSNFEEG